MHASVSVTLDENRMDWWFSPYSIVSTDATSMQAINDHREGSSQKVVVGEKALTFYTYLTSYSVKAAVNLDINLQEDNKRD